jgi:8-oxo-dGTP diphosphatase
MSTSLPPKVRVVSALIEREGRYLVTQRRPQATLPLLWEFPGGKVEPGETDQQALQRELMERLALEVRVAQREVEVDHQYEGYSLHLRTYRCHITDGVPRAAYVEDFRWAGPSELAELPFPGADQASVDALLEDT